MGTLPRSEKIGVSVFLSFLVGLLLLIGFCNVVEAQSILLNYASYVPETTPPSMQMERWAKEIEKRSGGKVEVKTFPSGTLVDAKNMITGVIDGQADIGVTCLAFYPGRFPLLSAVDLPIGFQNAMEASQTLFDLNEKYNPKSLDKVKVLTAFACPPANIMAKDPIRNLDDLKGYPLRCTGAGAPVLSLLGANPVAMPMSETPEALHKGTVKGIFSSLEILKAFKFSEICRHETICNLQTASFAVIMNKDKWASLPKEIQKIIDDMRREQSEWAAKCFDTQVEEALEWSKKEHDIELIRLSKSDMQKWLDMLRPATDQWLKDAAAAGIEGDKVLRDVFALKEHYAQK